MGADVRRADDQALELEEAAFAVFADADATVLPQRIVDVAIGVLAADCASIFLAEPDGRLRLAHSSATTRDGSGDACLIPGERGAGRVAVDRVPAIVHGSLDTECGSCEARPCGSEGSAIFYPLVRGERLYGVLCLTRGAGARRFEREDLPRAAVLASHAVLALENAVLLEDLRRRARELEAAHARLVEANRLATLGLATASVAHEIGNPLAFVGASVSFIASAVASWEPTAGFQKGSTPDDVAGAVNDAVDGLARIRDLLLDIRSYVRTPRAAAATFDVNESIRAAVRIARLPSMGLQTELELGEGLSVGGSPAKVTQVILNLVVNAAQAMSGQPRESRRLAIRTRAEDGRVVIRVADSGPGLPEAVASRLFQPFVTTKAEGTGLGLPICRDIVAQHGGEIRVDTGPSGTTFTISLPLATGRRAEPARATEGPTPIGRVVTA